MKILRKLTEKLISGLIKRMPENNSRGKIIAVDFDNTLVYEKWPGVGKIIPGAFEVLKELERNGHKIILYTQREHVAVPGCPDTLLPAINLVREQGIHLYAVNEFPIDDSMYPPSRKVYADVYIDDHGAMIPLIDYYDENGEYKPVVDWESIDLWLVNKGYYKNPILGSKRRDLVWI